MLMTDSTRLLVHCIEQTIFRLRASMQRRLFLLVFLVKPLSRIAAAILGRIGRKWWRKLPDSEKADLRNHLRQNRKLIAGSSIALAFGLGSFGYDSVSTTGP